MMDISGSLSALQRMASLYSSNISGAAVPGYKETTIDFRSVAAEFLDGPSNSKSNSNNEIVRPLSSKYFTGVRPNGIVRNMQNGDFKKTGEPLDFCIHGAGYFAVTDVNGNMKYTRNGSFSLNADRKITNKNGLILSGADGEIIIPDNIELNINSINVSHDGILTGKDRSGAQFTLGNIALYTFPNEQALEPESDGCYVSNDNCGPAISYAPGVNGAGVIRNGGYEASNVDPIESMLHASEVYQWMQMLASLETQHRDYMKIWTKIGGV